MSDMDKLMEAREMAIMAKGQADLALSKIDSHEVICANRYSEITSGLKNLWNLVLIVAGTLICGMAAIIIMLIQNGGHL